MSTDIRAWHSDPALKSDAITRMRAHAEADAIIQGNYIQHDSTAPGGYRGCFYGCLVTEMVHGVEQGEDFTDHLDWYSRAQELLGLPERFGRLAEGIFEALPRDEAVAFAVAITEAIPAGADLDRVVDKMMIAILSDPEHGCRQYAEPAGQAAIDTVVGLYRRRLAGDTPTEEEWSAARYAAADAAAAAWAAAAAAWAADAAARDAAADAAAAAADAYDAHVGARLWQAATLITLTAAAPTVIA